MLFRDPFCALSKCTELLTAALLVFCSPISSKLAASLKRLFFFFFFHLFLMGREKKQDSSGAEPSSKILNRGCQKLMDSCNSSLLKLSLQIMLKVSYSICCHAGTVSKRFSEIYSGPAVSAAEGPARAALSDSSHPPPPVSHGDRAACFFISLSTSTQLRAELK